MFHIPAHKNVVNPAAQVVNHNIAFDVAAKACEGNRTFTRVKCDPPLCALDNPDSLLDALEAAVAFVELHTGNGVQRQPPAWAILPNGDYNAQLIATIGRAVLDGDAVVETDTVARVDAVKVDTIA